MPTEILSDLDLEKEMPPRVLLPVDPQRLDNIAQFNQKERMYVVNDKLSNLTVHFDKRGTLVNVSSPDYLHVNSWIESKKASSQDSDSFAKPSCEDESTVNSLRNQFQFSDRSCQTYNQIVRQQGASTAPPPSGNHNHGVSPGFIFEAYLESIGGSKSGEDSSNGSGKGKSDSDPIYSDEMGSATRVMERILNLNADREVFSDFKYYEDRSDEFRDVGSLLPLWKFVNERAKSRQVTCLKWNPRYADLFAVAYGSYEFLHQGQGLVAVYSLKSSRSPEVLVSAESTVCCLDWNLEQPALIAVGLYDGSVAVIDVRSETRKFLFQSTIAENKHLDPIWEILWTPGGGSLSFNSVSVDGRISTWHICKSKLVCQTLSTLKVTEDPTPLAGKANALCFDFSATHPDMYLVGSEEGNIYLCVKFLPAQLAIFTHSNMAVYAVKWSPFHPNVFVSASADWTVKVWSSQTGSSHECLCVFELNQAVGDIAWSPLSSCIFAAVNADGNIFVFDLERNRNKEVCCQRIVPKGKLTRIALNDKEPVLLTADDRGIVYCLKLSPNLRGRKSAASSLPFNPDERKRLEHERLERVIKLLSDK